MFEHFENKRAVYTISYIKITVYIYIYIFFFLNIRYYILHFFDIL